MGVLRRILRVLAAAIVGLLCCGISVMVICWGSQVTSPQSVYHSPLSAAAFSNNTKEVQRLLDLGSAPDDGLTFGPSGILLSAPPIYFAAQRRNPTLVRTLIKAGASPSATLAIGGGLLGWCSSLAVALGNDDAKTTRLLLDNGADVNAGLSVGPFGLILTGSPLSAMIAAPYILREADDMVTLLKRGADPHWGVTGILGTISFSPLYAAASAGNPAAVKALLDYGAVPTRGITVIGVSMRTPAQVATDIWSQKDYIVKTIRMKNFDEIGKLLNESIKKRERDARADL